MVVLCIIVRNNFGQTIGLSIASGTGEGCAPLTVNFINESSAGFVSFGWDWNNDFIADSIADPDNAGQTVSHTFFSPNLMGRVNLIGVKANGEAPSASYPVRVWAPNSADFSLALADICETDASVTRTSVINDNGANHLCAWDFGDGTGQTGWITDGTVTHTYGNSGFFEITMTDSNSCGSNSVSKNIHVTMLNPQIVLSPDDVVCQGEMLGFSDTNQTNPLVQYLWTFEPGHTSSLANPDHMYLSEGNYEIKLKEFIPNQCADSVTLNVNVLPGPVSAFLASVPSQCDSSRIAFLSTSTTESGDVFHWDFGNGQTLDAELVPDSVFYESAGVYVASLSISRPLNSCVSIFSDTLIIPKIKIDSLFSSTVCFNVPSNLGAFVVAIPPELSYSWTFPDGTDSTASPVYTFSNPGINPVGLTVNNGFCSDTRQFEVYVKEPPQPVFIEESLQGCNPFRFVAVNNSENTDTWYWKINNNVLFANADTLDYTFELTPPALQDSVLNVSLVATSSGGCEAELPKQITVFHAPFSVFVMDTNFNAPTCNPVTIQFTNHSLGADGFSWDFGDGTTSADSIVEHTFTNTTHYFQYFQVFLKTFTNQGCKDSLPPQYITLYPLPRTDFVMDTISTCSPALVDFIAPAEYNGVYTWTFNPNDILTTTAIHSSRVLFNIGETDTTYMVSLQSQNQFGCTAVDSQELVIHPLPNPDFGINPNPALVTDQVSFTPVSENFASWVFQWVFNNEMSNPEMGYLPVPRSFDSFYDVPVQLSITTNFGCKDSLTQILGIIPPTPILDFVADTLQGCPILTVRFTDQSRFTDTTTYLWDFADGSYSRKISPVHIFYDGGNKQLKLTGKGLDGTNLQKDTLVEVFHLPSASFSIQPSDVVWVPDNPVEVSADYPGEGYSYFWSFGNQDSSGLSELVYYFQDTGQFLITLIVQTPRLCSDTLSKSIVAKTAGNVRAPNVFYPGGGGGGSGGLDGGAFIDEGDPRNDIFAPLTDGVVEYHLEIWNRWGERLFKSDSKEIGWTGYYRGKLCKEDVYVWKVFGKYANRKEFIKAGTITLIHK